MALAMPKSKHCQRHLCLLSAGYFTIVVVLSEKVSMVKIANKSEIVSC